MRSDVDAAYRLHGPALFRYLVRMTGDEDLAADVLHDAFARLITRPPKREDNLRGWLFRVATNRLRDRKRRDARRRSSVTVDRARALHGDPAPSPDLDVLRGEATDWARAVLDRLSERDRAILLLREEGFTHREIAEAVGSTTKSVGTLVARALDRFRNIASRREAIP